MIELIVAFIFWVITKDPLTSGAFLVIFLLLSYLYIEKIDKWVSIILKAVKAHRNRVLIFSTIILIFISYPSLHDIYLNINPPTPSENQLVVAITPFYCIDGSGKESYDINIRDNFKDKLDNLEIKIILLDNKINNIEDAKFQGQKAGAHLIIYGETKKTSIDTGNIEYNILPLSMIENLFSELSSLDYAEKGHLKLSDKILFSADEPITITESESLVSNASSAIAIIAAFDKYIRSDYVSAISFFESSKNYGSNSNIFFYIANCYLLDNNLNKSLQNLDKAIEINPRFGEAWKNKGDILIKFEHYEEALGAFDKAIEINPQEAGAWNNKGGILIELKRYEEALDAFDKAIEIDSHGAGAWNNKGLAFDNLGRHKEALDAFDKAIEINELDAGAWSNKCIALANLGIYEEAIISCDKATKINPKFAEAWFNKGVAFGGWGKYNESIASYDKAIEINQQYVEAWFNKGAAFEGWGKYNESIAAYDKAIEINPQEAGAWNNKGGILIKLGRYEEALDVFDKAIKINPQEVGVLNNKGVALYNLGRHEEALAAFDKAIEMNPKSVDAWNNKELTLVKFGRTEEVNEVL